MADELNTAEAKRLLGIAKYHNTKVTEHLVLAELECKKLHNFVAENDKEIARIERELKNA